MRPWARWRQTHPQSRDARRAGRDLEIDTHALKPGSLIRSKLRPPPQPSGLLRRARLIDLLGAGHARVTVVQAPSGFGKSTLLAQCYESWREQGLAAWLSLDEDDRDPSLFVAALIAAFAAAGVELGGLLNAAEAGLPATRPRSALAALLNPLNSLGAPGILFIDDLHRAQTPDTAALLQTFQSHLNPNLRLVIAGRTRPDLDLAKLAAQGELRLIAAESLRFTAEEARHQFGEWDAEQLQTLVRHTDGWPVALQLARIYLAEGNGGHALERFTGRTPELAAYLAEQVFSDLPQVLQTVLMAIAFVERINGDLINALCERTDGWRLLEEIESRNLFVSPLDEERRWFHFHKVFSEFLQEQCRKHGGLPIPELHQRAATWFLERGLLEEATRHASLAEDPSLAAQLLERVGGWRMLLRGGTSVIRVLAALSSALAGPTSRLELCRVVLLAKEQRIVDARAALDELREQTCGFTQWREGARDYSADGLLIDHVLRIYEDKEPDVARLDALESEMHRDPVHDNAVLALVDVVRGQAAYAGGDLPASRRHGEAGIARCRSVGAGYIEIFGHLNVGLALLAQGLLSRAESTIQAALEVAARVLGPGNSLTCPLSAVLAEVRYERGNLEEARQLLDFVLPALDEGDVWFDILASVCSTNTSLAAATDGVHSALQRLDEMADLADRRGMPRLRDWVMIERVRVLTQSGRAALAADAAGTRLQELADHRESEGSLRFRLWAPAVIGAARLANAQHRHQDALRLASDAAEVLRRRGQMRLLVPALVQQAIAHLALGDALKAGEVLRATFDLGVPREFRRSVVDERSLAQPLFTLCSAYGESFSWAERAFLREALAEAAPAAQVLTSPPPPPPAAGRPGEPRAAEHGSLSPREAQILSLLVDGHTNKEMARQLAISESTVVTHRRRLYKKLHVTSRSKAIAAARVRPANA